jgi:proline dehydrogenase
MTGSFAFYRIIDQYYICARVITPSAHRMEIEPAVSFDDTKIAFSYKSDRELGRANFIFSLVNHPFVSSLATGAVRLALALRLPVKGLIRSTVFEHFCGGEDIAESQDTVDKLGRFHIGTILDYAVEGEKTEAGFEATTDEVIHTIDRAKGNENIPFCVFKVTGIGDASLLEKIQSKQPLSASEQQAHVQLKKRVERICQRAAETEVRLLIDAEQSWLQDPIDALVDEMMRRFNKTRAIVFNTYQMYRLDMVANLRGDFHDAVTGNYFLGVKLVRGAYMEKEAERAKKMDYPNPIHESKQQTDDAFNKALSFCLDNKQRISFMCGSHNEYSNKLLTVLMEKHGMKPSDSRVWFAQLLGMGDHISFNLAQAGYNVAKYVPYGPVEAVMPYLIRRAQENTSVAGQSSRELSLIRKEVERRKATA